MHGTLIGQGKWKWKKTHLHSGTAANPGIAPNLQLVSLGGKFKCNLFPYEVCVNATCGDRLESR
jgi:hypothetical protein